MWALSCKEINSKPDENLVDMLFKQDISSLKVNKISYRTILQSIINGGYPEIQKITSARGRKLWFDSYISTYVERDIRDVGELRDIDAFIRFFNALTPRSSGLLNKSSLAAASSLSEPSVSNYLAMLEMIYQISLLRPYTSNISKRFIKAPKLFLTDSGLFCHILGINSEDELLSSQERGAVFETFIYSELLKHISYSSISVNIYHYRTNDKKEIDFILECGNKIIAIEVKSSQSIKLDAFKHIIDFQNKSSKDVVGIIFYGGETILPFGDKKHERFAIPINILF